MHGVERVDWTAEQRQLIHRIEAHAFEHPDRVLDFTGRLARDRGWSPGFARGAVAEYRRFCFLATISDTPATPSEEVDEVWHQHLTYSRDYWEIWCGEVLRRPLHHDPTEGGPAEQGRYRMQYAETLARYEAFFGPSDPLYWPATHRRFRSGPRYRIVDTDRVLLLPRPGFGRLLRPSMAIWLGLAALCVTARPAAALPLDPLDWTAGPFLTLYAGLTAAALVLMLVLRSILTDRDEAVPTAELDIVELGYLAGGRNRATDAAIVGLIAAGAASYATGSGHITVEDRGVALPPALERFRGLAEGTVPRSTMIRAMKPRLDAVRESLIARGLMPGRDMLKRFTGWTLATAAPVLALGLAKMAVGAARGKPVGYLALMSVALVVLTILILSMRPTSTRAGDRALADHRERYARAARAPRADEVPLAFALGGAVVLTGTPFEAYARFAHGVNAGSMGGGSGGDGGYGGGGEGGGSDGGGGGGCGGCGGGS